MLPGADGSSFLTRRTALVPLSRSARGPVVLVPLPQWAAAPRSARAGFPGAASALGSRSPTAAVPAPPGTASALAATPRSIPAHQRGSADTIGERAPCGPRTWAKFATDPAGRLAHQVGARRCRALGSPPRPPDRPGAAGSAAHTALPAAPGHPGAVSFPALAAPTGWVAWSGVSCAAVCSGAVEVARPRRLALQFARHGLRGYSSSERWRVVLAAIASGQVSAEHDGGHPPPSTFTPAAVQPPS